MHENIALSRPRESSIVGMFGETSIGTKPGWVVIDMNTRNFDVSGHVCREHALARLNIEEAVSLHMLLGVAIQTADDGAIHELDRKVISA